MCMIYVLDIKMYYFLFLLIYRSTISLLMLLISKKNIKLSECHSKLQYDSKMSPLSVIWIQMMIRVLSHKDNELFLD